MTTTKLTSALTCDGLQHYPEYHRLVERVATLADIQRMKRTHLATKAAYDAAPALADEAEWLAYEVAKNELEAALVTLAETEDVT